MHKGVCNIYLLSRVEVTFAFYTTVQHSEDQLLYIVLPTSFMKLSYCSYLIMELTYFGAPLLTNRIYPFMVSAMLSLI